MHRKLYPMTVELTLERPESLSIAQNEGSGEGYLFPVDDF